VFIDNKSVSLLAKEGCSGNPFLIFPVLTKSLLEIQQVFL